MAGKCGMVVDVRTCAICGTQRKQLQQHLKIDHGVEFEDYVIATVHDGKRPTCRCGCGEETEYVREGRCCFRVFVIGHRPKKKKKTIIRNVSHVVCGLCGLRFHHIARHVRSTHGLDPLEYQLQHVHGGAWPKCACGCEEDVRARNGREIVNRFIKGHESRGRQLSDEHRRKIGEKSSASISKRWIDDREGMLELQAKGQETFKVKYPSDVWSKKISSSIVDRYLSGGIAWSVGSYVSSKAKETYHYRSSWELMHMEHLDADPSVVGWKYEPLSIEYEHDGRMRRYIPDFFVRYADGRRELHEVGVRSMKESRAIDIAKSTAARAYCVGSGMTYRLVDGAG